MYFPFFNSSREGFVGAFIRDGVRGMKQNLKQRIEETVVLWMFGPERKKTTAKDRVDRMKERLEEFEHDDTGGVVH